jgi:hypothetical protein
VVEVQVLQFVILLHLLATVPSQKKERKTARRIAFLSIVRSNKKENEKNANTKKKREANHHSPKNPNSEISRPKKLQKNRWRKRI